MHHANLVLGQRTTIDAYIQEHIDTPTIDRVVLESDQVGIGDVQPLIESAAQKPVAGPHRTIIIICRTITLQAQNALLKLFEEPALTTRFFLCLPADSLLPTLRSRVTLIHRSPEVTDDFNLANKFLEASYPERLSQLANFTKKKDDASFITLARELIITMKDVREPKPLRDLITLNTYIEMSGGSKKMLLEHLALSLPITKKIR